MQNGLVQKECPLCGATISLGSRALAKKIRCPQCREVVVVASGNADYPTSTPAKAKQPAAAAKAAPISLPENAPEFAVEPMRHGAGYIDEKRRSILLRHLASAGERSITISAPADDPDALLLAHSLQKVYRSAGWNASESALLHTNGKHHCSLALYTGALPFPEEVTKSCMALTVAGLEFTSHIDPEQVSEKAILVVGREIGKAADEAPPEPPACPPPAQDIFHPVFEELSEREWQEEVKRAGSPEQEGWLRRVRDAGSAGRLEADGVLPRGMRLAEAIAGGLLAGSAVREEDCQLLRELGGVLSALRKGDDEARRTRQCAQVALAALNDHPAGESLWVSALRFADAAFARPPVADDPEAQDVFEALLARTFRDRGDPLQRIIATEVRAWHWYRTPERRALHDKLFYQETSCESVVEAALERLPHWPAAERARILRGLLQRDDVADRENLAETLGHVLGWECMHVDGEKPLEAEALACEVLASPAPFLNNPAVRGEFLRHFVVGMTEGAKLHCANTELAEDYAALCHNAWLQLEALEEAGKDPRRVVLIATRWLAKPQRRADFPPDALAPWWRCVCGMLLDEAIRDGGVYDIYMVFATLREGAFADVATVREIFDLIAAYLRRIEDGLENGTLPAETPLVNEKGEQPSWRDIAACIADLLTGLLNEGRLTEPGDLERARQFLLRLASEFGGSWKAAEAVLRLEQVAPPAAPGGNDTPALSVEEEWAA